jgi:hypothetical protein
MARHKKCNHFYLVRKNSHKEGSITETKDQDVGNCSCCWKYSKTPTNLKRNARELVDLYHDQFSTDPEYQTYNLVDLENMYYKWLYEDFEPERPERQGSRPNRREQRS